MDINAIITYRNRAINAGIIILAISISFAMYNSQMAVIESLKQAKDMEIKKNTALGGVNELEKRVKLYKDFINRKDPTALVNSFNNIARVTGVTITSLKPGRLQDLPMYSKYSFSMAVTASSFSQLGKFISKLESDPDIFLVDTAAVRVGGRSEEDQAKDYLSLDLNVSTIMFK
jgi:hypothetical protein